MNFHPEFRYGNNISNEIKYKNRNVKKARVYTLRKFLVKIEQKPVIIVKSYGQT